MLKETVKNYPSDWKAPSGTFLATLQDKAHQAFQATQFPTTVDEEWKYTNTKKIISANYSIAHTVEITPADMQPFLPQEDVYLLVYVNGIFRPDFSTPILSEYVAIHNLYEAYTSHNTIIDSYLANSTLHAQTPFTAMNSAWVRHGAFVYVKKNKIASKPIYLLHIQDTRTSATLSQMRHLIVAEENAQIQFTERYYTLGNAESLTNLASEVFVAKGANISHDVLQTEGEKSSIINFTQVHQAEGSYYTNNTVTLSGQLIRNNLHIALNGERAESFMNGLYMLKGSTHTDNHTVVDHKAPNCQSNELYKGLLADRSTGVFNGKIFVRQDAQKTNAYQSNKNILLSENATMNTKPQLEIWADDVKCSHGTTTGALDEEPLFYLKSRGIGEEKARALLVYAFVGEILEKIRTPYVRSMAENTVQAWLDTNLDD